MWRLLLSTALLPAMAATAMSLEFDAFLEIHKGAAEPALPGASQDKIYYGWTKIYGFEHGSMNGAPLGENSLSEKAAFLPIKFAKAVDQLSPVIMRGVCMGTKFSQVKLVLVARDKGRTEMWNVTFRNVAVTEQTWTTAHNGIPLEGVRFNCGEMLVNFTSISNPTISAAAGWDVVKNGPASAETHEPLSLDSDNDGIPDVFEKRYGLNPDVPDSSADLDGDGMSNLLEYIANTDPRRPDSVLRAQLKPLPTPGMLELSWQGTPGTTYRVEYSDALGAPYHAAGTYYTETAQEMKTLVPVNGQNSRFYRVTVVE